ncbi:MAG: J domain-containing protein [Acidobacteriota bacterium]|nr:J domain-containing protein [Acidobacteriota bacterium]
MGTAMDQKPEDLRSGQRRTTNCTVEMVWKSESGERYFDQCRALNLSETGVAVECPEAIPPSSNVVLWAKDFQVAALAQVRHCTWQKTTYVMGLHFLSKTSTVPKDTCAPDHYEILRLSPMADQDTIERVYRTLIKRFHPDNKITGDAEAFIRISDAYRILSDPKKRRRYDEERKAPSPTPRFQLPSREFFNGVRGEQNRRFAVMSLLYRRRSSNHDSPGLSLLELEQLTGCTREELGFALWYLSERGLVRVGDNVQYCLSAAGVDLLEEKMAEHDATDLRTLAAVAPPQELLTAGSRI